MPSEAHSVVVPQAEPVVGRLAMLTGLSVFAASIPIPFVPDRVLKQVRGATAHEAVSRHGLSLSSDARQELARPNPDDRLKALMRKALEVATRSVLKRLGPLAPLTALVRAYEVYALGHLLDRYLDRHRRTGAVRIHQPEARMVRELIDRSVRRSLHPATRPHELLSREGEDDLRDELTRWFDALLLGAASLPSYVVRRLDAAFDELAPRPDERLSADANDG